MDGSEAAIQQALVTGNNPALLERVLLENRILPHNYRHIHSQWLDCDLQGCQTKFRIEVIPGQVVYPRYCEAHRSEHRRQHFLRQQGSP